ncbi:MAG: glycosyltransferase [Methanosarcina sp.]|nr:glycosyltransferase [Methanosarcina sp.]MDD4522985.1 glycosyltransferase [Methanosarcina sp.]
MHNKSFSIVQVSTSDIGGGAEKIAWNLLESHKLHDFDSWLVVGNKRSINANIILLQNDIYRGPWARFWISIGNVLSLFVSKVPGTGLLKQGLCWVGQTRRFLEILQGREDFDFPATSRLLELTNGRPDIIHCHNLHGGYFDLRALPQLSQQVPVILTLHDAWLLSGHCAHSFDCERWKTGCGNCPDLTIYPRILKDATAYNWERKNNIFKQSRLFVVTPCQWLMDKVNESMLKPGVINSCVIPNGVNTKIFQPYSKKRAREELGLHSDEKIILFTANGIRKNIWKDYKTLKSSLSIISAHKKRILCIALGENTTSECIGSVEIRFIPFQRDPGIVARYYQAADVYVHPSRVDTFPNTVLEALACGTPVVASNVGGIPEQIIEGKTGYLVPEGDAEGMAEKIICLLENEYLNKQMGLEAAEDAKKRFSLEQMVNNYLMFYKSILKNNE